MDPLSAVLKSVRLEGAIYLNAEFTAPWCIRGRFGLARIRARLPHSEHVVFFHCLTEGACKVRLANGGEELHVAAGDVVLFPRDDRHLMGSDLHLVPLETETVEEEPGDAGRFIQLRHGGGGEATRFVCGYLGCSRALVRPLLEALPRLLRITIGEGQARALLSSLLQVGVTESQSPRPGTESMLARVAELMFVEALRAYAERASPETTGWFAGLRDAQVGRALALIHEEPGRAWTVDTLAREVALSRSALAGRFTTLVGEPPMQYLTRWRLALAAHALRAGDEAIVHIAQRAGYESEAAFNRAFKREFGVPPAAWRRAASADASRA